MKLTNNELELLILGLSMTTTDADIREEKDKEIRALLKRLHNTHFIQSNFNNKGGDRNDNNKK